MLPVFMRWFPSEVFARIFGIIVVAAVLMDEIIPRLSGGRGFSLRQGLDRGSSIAIQLAALIGFGVALSLRYQNIGIVAPWIQILAIVLLILGTLLREWSVFLLGRFFSRTVQIERGHRLITEGPYRWIRHPAYTGMLIMDAAIVLSLGTWAGALFMFVILLAALLYRIRVEEHALLEAFGDDYRAYMSRTGRLLPGW
jgi:protein-S-isoprenylcysteine O-methyltransferase Ste14